VCSEQLIEISGHLTDTSLSNGIHSSRSAGDRWAALQTLSYVELRRGRLRRVTGTTDPW
jgi:hypothetical protein